MLIAGCSPDDTDKSDGKDEGLTIYTSIYPLQYFAERIGQHNVDVKSIIPPGADGHTYEPTTRELVKVAESDMLIYNGAGFEGFVEKAKESLKKQDVVFVNASRDIQSSGHEEENHEEENHEDGNHEEDEHGHEEAHGHGDVDPHFWLDPVQAIQMAETIKKEMIALHPEKKDEFEANFQQLKKDLSDLDRDFKELVENAKRKEFIVAHSAYGKWERYGLKQISIAGLSPSHEPSQKEIQAIIDYARENEVKYIIFEKNYTSDVAEMIQREVKAEKLYLSNLESLTEEQVQNKEDYLNIMYDNLDTLKTALN